MIIDSCYLPHQNYTVFDCLDQKIGYATSYNTETKEITMYLPLTASLPLIKLIHHRYPEGDIGPKVVTFILEGSYAKDPLGNKIDSPTHGR